jgi:hypothetical protein
MRGGIQGALVGCVVVVLLALAAAPAAAAPANDDFAGAQALGAALPVVATGSDVGATGEAGEPEDFSGAARHSVWFGWEATKTGAVTVATCGSEPGVLLGVYTGTTVGGLTRIASAAPDGSAPYCGSARLRFDAVAGQQYWISVDDSGEDGGFSLTLERTAPPANDSFAAAQPLSLESPEGLMAENWGATKETGEPMHRGDPGGASFWYSIAADHTGGVVVSTCGESSGPQLDVAVYSGAVVSGLAGVPENQSTSSCAYSFEAIDGSTYYVAVDGRPGAQMGSTDEGHFSITAEDSPGNDDLADAFELPDVSQGGVSLTLTNVGATKEVGEPDHAGNPGGHSVWFSWTASANGSARVLTCTANFDSVVAVYTGHTMAALRPIWSEHLANAFCPLSEDTSGGFNIDAGRTYLIAVDGFDGAVGRSQLGLIANTQRLRKASSPPAASSPGSSLELATSLRRRRFRPRRGLIEFDLGSTLAGSGFRCRLDGKPFHACPVRVVLRHLRPRRHVFRAEAVAGEATDATPAVWRFRVPTSPPSSKRSR